MTSGGSGPQEPLGHRLRQVSNHMSQSLARRLEATGVTGAEWAMMRLLPGREPVPSGELAARMGMTRGAVTRLADRLIAKGLMRREGRQEDARTRMLSLTPRGTALLPDLAALADENEAHCFALLRPEERAVLAAVLDRLIEGHGLTGVGVD
ncbi:MAG: MarR family transcriptional regulator [Sphingobium sp.]